MFALQKAPVRGRNRVEEGTSGRNHEESSRNLWRAHVMRNLSMDPHVRNKKHECFNSLYPMNFLKYFFENHSSDEDLYSVYTKSEKSEQNRTKAVLGYSHTHTQTQKK